MYANPVATSLSTPNITLLYKHWLPAVNTCFKSFSKCSWTTYALPLWTLNPRNKSKCGCRSLCKFSRWFKNSQEIFYRLYFVTWMSSLSHLPTNRDLSFLSLLVDSGTKFELISANGMMNLKGGSSGSSSTLLKLSSNYWLWSMSETNDSAWSYDSLYQIKHSFLRLERKYAKSTFFRDCKIWSSERVNRAAPSISSL